MLVIDDFYHRVFERKTCDNLTSNESLAFLNRAVVNEPIDVELGDVEALKHRLLNLNFDDKEKCVIFNVYRGRPEKFDFMLKIVREIKGESDLNWFVREVINLKYHKDRSKNSSFFKDIADRFRSENGLSEFTEMLNVLFLSPLRLFNEWIIFHSEEAFLSEIASKSFMTMDILIVAITPMFDKLVMIQGVLTKVDLRCCPCITL